MVQGAAEDCQLHSHLNDILKRALTLCDFTCLLEPPGLSPNINMRPDGMTLVPWKNGRKLVWDATCYDTIAPHNLGTINIPGG